jgi:predicted dithiol-disulfide oxidoreductase (DUF899 family)
VKPRSGVVSARLTKGTGSSIRLPPAARHPHPRERADAAGSSEAGATQGRPQLLIYHFLFDPIWDEGCPSWSFLVDNIGHLAHLHARDTTRALVSRAPIVKIEPYRQRMGWTVPWYSSFGSDFNYDFHVTLDQAVGPVEYNYRGLTELGRSGQPRLGHHLAGEVDADDLGVREALGDRECAGTCAGAEIERAPGRLDCLERGDERCEAVLGSDRLPTGSQEIELELYRPPQQAPERRPADDERRRNPGKATADREPDVHARMEMRATCPEQLASVAAASPPVIDKPLDDRDGLLGAAAPEARAERRLELLLELAGLRQLLRDVGAADQLAADEDLRDRRPAGERRELLADLRVGEDVDSCHWRARAAQRFQRPRRVPAHGPLRRALHEQGHRLVRDDLLDLLAHLAH